MGNTLAEGVLDYILVISFSSLAGEFHIPGQALPLPFLLGFCFLVTSLFGPY
jgi:hypothetical protein